MENLVADRVKENGLIISYLLPNKRNCLAIAHFEEVDSTRIFFKMKNSHKFKKIVNTLQN